MGEYGQLGGQSTGGGGLPAGGAQDLGGQFATALSDAANQVVGLPPWAQALLLVAVIVVGLWILRRAF